MSESLPTADYDAGLRVWPPASWCSAINPEQTNICDQPLGHDGDHSGPEMPTVTLDEGDPSGTFCEHGWHFQNPEPCPGCWPDTRPLPPGSGDTQ